jgi:hypothetical protein
MHLSSEYASLLCIPKVDKVDQARAPAPELLFTCRHSAGRPRKGNDALAIDPARVRAGLTSLAKIILSLRCRS